MKRYLPHTLGLGLILYSISALCANLSFTDLTTRMFDILSSVGFLLLGLLTMTTLEFKKTDVLTKVLRAVTLQSGFWGSFALDSLIGITRILVPMETENFAWGMIFLTCWIILTAVSVLEILGTAIVRTIEKISGK